MSELHHLLYNGKFDILLITETWLHDDIISGLLDPDGMFHILRKDRHYSRGGGVCAFIRKNLNVSQVVISDSYSTLELLCFDLLCGKTKLRFFVIYRPPNYDGLAEKYVDLLIECLSLHATIAQSNIIVGDLNCPKIDWQNATCPADRISRLLLDFTVNTGMYQLVDFATRANNILDVLLTDDEQIITDIAADSPIGHSDHLMVTFKIILVVNTAGQITTNPVTKGPAYNWRLADFDAMHEYLSCVDWQSVVYHHPSALDAWSVFIDVINIAVSLFVPKCKAASPSATRRLRHYPHTLRKLTRKKRSLWKKCRNSPQNPIVRGLYRDCANQWRQEIRNIEMAKENDIIESNNIGTFFKFVNKRLKYRNAIGALVDDGGNTVTNDDEKATLFNEYFGSVGVVDDGVIPVCTFMPSHDDCVLEMVEFNALNVLAAMNRLKSNLSSGPDSLPSLLFKRLRHCLAAPLALMFSQLFSVSAVPSDWKRAVITPVFKKGVTGKVCNYRPISLTCVPSKIMERVIACQMYDHFKAHGILHRAQHGFRSGRSTSTNLLESFNDWILSIEYKHSVTVAYVDFSKAFDSVSHDKLFIRLASYGIRGNLSQWLREYFSARTHQTRVGLSLSAVTKLLSGVVQGSGIGPLLFLTYINELAEILERSGVMVKLLADDVKLYMEIVNDCDTAKLQYALNLLSEWADMWQLSVSIDKCCVLGIGRMPLTAPTDFYIGGHALSFVSSCRDLGVMVSHDLKPTTHIKQIVTKAHQRANAILRSFVSRDTDLLLRAFTVYVLPLLEYNSIVWSPQGKQDIECIERVQRRYTKRLPGLKTYSYESRLQRLNLTTLELRRLHIDLIWCYKIVFGLVDVKFEDFFKHAPLNQTRGHMYKLYKQRSSTNVVAAFFVNRVVDVWNCLPVDIVDFTSLTAFKRTFKLVDFTEFLKCI